VAAYGLTVGGAVDGASRGVPYGPIVGWEIGGASRGAPYGPIVGWEVGGAIGSVRGEGNGGAVVVVYVIGCEVGSVGGTE
jgi:hypothetical protein